MTQVEEYCAPHGNARVLRWGGFGFIVFFLSPFLFIFFLFVLNRKKGNNRCRIGRGSGRNPRHVIEYVFGRISSGRNAWTGFGKVTRIIHTSIGNALPDQSE